MQQYQTISKFHYKQQSYGPEPNLFQCCPVTLKVATGSLCTTDQLFHTMSKFHHKQQSYGLEKNLLQGRSVTLTEATKILRATRRLVMMIICAKLLYAPPTFLGQFGHKIIQCNT